ncbi:hypothetical protein FRC03_003496 [Tulasnella sp. 419]|nr:hypothetical protein FRC03_003496 [Tulasnella sp. 419]
MDSLEVQGRRRQEKYSGLKTWRLKLVIELLPMFLQLSLLLFLIGVVKLLREWDQEVAAIQLILSCAGLAVYCVTIIIGIMDPSSPFQTPLSRFVQRYSSKMNLTLGLSVFQDFSTHASMERLLNLPYQTLRWVQDSFGVVVPGVESPILPTNALVPQGGNPKKGRSKWDSGLVADAEAVIWLLERAEHPDVAITALDAVRHLPPSLVHRLIHEREGLLKKLIAFHHNLLPLALSTENQAKWLDAWPDAAVVSALAWNHILWAESLDHKDRLAIRSSLSESDPYCHANVSEVLENNQDRYLSAKCLLMFSLGGYHGLNVEDLLKRCIKHDTVSLSASPHIRIKFPDASRAFNRDIVTSFSPLQLMLDSVMNLLSVPDIRWTSSSQDYLLEHLDSLLQGELSHDTVSYAAIAFAAIRSGTSNYPDSNPNVSFGIPSRPRQRRLVGYQERDSQEVMNEVRTQINRWMATRTNAPDRGLILLEHVSLAVSVVRGGKDEDIGILKTLLDMTSNLFEEKYRYPEQPIPYQYFPRDLVQLARLAPNDEHMQVLVAKLLCQCPDGDWTTLLREDLGQDIQTIFKFALENDHNDFLVGHLVERVKDDIQFLDPPTRLIALRNYCIKKVRNHKLTASIDASTWFSQFMPKNNGEYLDGTNLLQTQVSCATMILIIGQAESGVSNDTLFMYFETLLARDPDLIRPEDVGIPGLMGGWGQQLSHVWRGEALLLLWRMAKKARYLDGSPSKWESSLFFSSQVGDLMLEYSVEVLKRRYNSMDYGKLLRDYLETKLQVWRTSNREGLERRRQIEDIVQKLGQFFD